MTGSDVRNHSVDSLHLIAVSFRFEIALSRQKCKMQMNSDERTMMSYKTNGNSAEKFNYYDT